MKKCTLTSFVALEMRSNGNAPNNQEPVVGFSFTTMLQHTGRFCPVFSYQRTWQYWSIPHNLLTRLELIFTCSSTEISIEGRRSCDAIDISKIAMEELKRFSQNGFQKRFQRLYSRWQKYIVAQGDYFEGNVTHMSVLFCISQKESDSGNILKIQRIDKYE
jgi:hypothetical protein